MSNRDMKLDVLIRLRDQMTGGLRKMTAGLDKLSSAMRKIGAVGAIISGLSFMGPMESAAGFNQTLLDIAGTAELTGAKAFTFTEELKARYEDLALKIGQSSQTIAEGAGLMIAAGLDLNQVDGSLQAIGRAATAANADFNDMASVATSMMQNLGVKPEEIEDSLGALVAAGKLGSFELKDMAKEFPNLTSQLAKFGVTGREAVNFLGSGLQIAMKGAASPAEAANNFKNFLAKVLSPRVVKNFAEMGVDIGAVMQDAAAKGINPLEAVLQKVQKLTGVSGKEINKYLKQAKDNGLEGAEALHYVQNQLEKIGAAGKISQLFNDQSVMDFLIPMLGNIDEYLEIKEQVAKATGAMTDADFETQIKGLNRQMVIFKEIGAQASREVGLAFGAWLPMINDWLMSSLGLFRDWDEKLGGWLKKGLMLGAGLTLLAVGIGALGLVVPLLTAGFAALGAVLGVILSPIGLVIGLIAGAGYLIYKNWDKVAPYFKKFWTGLKNWAGKAWDGIKSTSAKTWGAMKSAWSKAAPFMRDLGSRWVQGWVEVWGLVKRGWAKFEPYIKTMWGKYKAAASDAWEVIEREGLNAWGKLKAGSDDFFASDGWQGFKASAAQAYDEGLSDLERRLENVGNWLGQRKREFDDAFKVPPLDEYDAKTNQALNESWSNLTEIDREIRALLKPIGDVNRELAAIAWDKLQEGTGHFEKLLEPIREATKIAAEKTASGFATMLGQHAAGMKVLFSVGMAEGAQGLRDVTGGLRDLVKAAAQGEIDWTNFFPETVVNAIKMVAAAIDQIKQGLQWLGETGWGIIENTAAMVPSPTDLLPAGFVDSNKQAFNAVTSQIGESLSGWFGGNNQSQLVPVTSGAVAGGNASLAAGMRPVELVIPTPPVQKVDVDVGTVKSELAVRYAQPLTGPSLINMTAKATAKSDGGLAVGRP